MNSKTIATHNGNFHAEVKVTQNKGVQFSVEVPLPHDSSYSY